MSSLVENLEKAGTVNEELEALIREAHSTMRALRDARREMDEAVARAQVEARELLGDLMLEKLAPHVETMSEEIQAKVDEQAERVINKFKKISGPLMRAITEFQEWGIQAGLLLTEDGTASSGPFTLPGKRG